MRSLESLNFETHAHIKNIIGKDMINDDNIAVKELVKNSIDADATEVNVHFKRDRDSSEDEVSEIIIQDNGSGMSFDDIRQKWANMAYSSKKSDDKRAYAGNKGIGRFSADRLGRILNLYTKQKGANEIIKIRIDWQSFENKIDWEERIQKIKFDSYSLTQEEFANETGMQEKFIAGTYLRIIEPRYPWSSIKLQGLRKDLEKFMIPSQVEGGDKFKLFLYTSGYNNDGELSGKIKNQVFDKLPFKTSYIKSAIDEDGEKISTELYHRGELLIHLVEKNKFNYLKNANILVFYLNQYHRAFFKRQTGISSLSYGSIFLYLNGFRVPPYGDIDNDWLDVARRHGLGYQRYLGLRDIIGRIELKDYSGKIYEVTSDREGIKRNDAFLQITGKEDSDSFFLHALRKFESFISEGLLWDSTDEKTLDIEKRLETADADISNFDMHYKESESNKEKKIIQMLGSIISRGTKREDVLSLNLGDVAVEILKRQEAEDIEKLQNKLSYYEDKIKSDGKNIRLSDIAESVRKAESKIKNLKREVSNLEEGKKEVEQKLEVSEKRRLFAEFQSIPDKEKLKEIIHLTGTWGQAIEDSLDAALQMLRNNEDLATENLVSPIEEIESAKISGAKIAKLSRLITKANFALMSEKAILDIFYYIDEYIKEIKDLGPYTKKLKIFFSNKNNAELVRNMSPVEVSMLVDNIIINAIKNGASHLHIAVEVTELSTKLIFKDDGNGLTDEFLPEELFHAGITTTDGSGIGLNQVYNLACDLKARARISNNDNRGASVILEWKNETKI